VTDAEPLLLDCTFVDCSAVVGVVAAVLAVVDLAVVGVVTAVLAVVDFVVCCVVDFAVVGAAALFVAAAVVAAASPANAPVPVSAPASPTRVRRRTRRRPASRLEGDRWNMAVIVAPRLGSGLAIG
jgi:hypothetical protein